MLIPISDGDPAAWDIVKTGFGRVSFRPVDKAAVPVAAVKSAFLAACAVLDELPDSPRSDALRRDLLAARDSSRATTSMQGSSISELKIVRGPLEPVPGEVAVVHLPIWREHQYWIAFHNSVFVEWPLELGLLLPHLRAANTERRVGGE